MFYHCSPTAALLNHHGGTGLAKRISVFRAPIDAKARIESRTEGGGSMRTLLLSLLLGIAVLGATMISPSQADAQWWNRRAYYYGGPYYGRYYTPYYGGYYSYPGYSRSYYYNPGYYSSGYYNYYAPGYSYYYTPGYGAWGYSNYVAPYTSFYYWP
jgi:hypothetical protein